MISDLTRGKTKEIYIAYMTQYDGFSLSLWYHFFSRAPSAPDTLSCCSLSTEECFHLRALAHAVAFAQNVPQMSTQLVPSFPFKNVFTESIHSNHCINKKVPYREILSPLPLLHSSSWPSSLLTEFIFISVIPTEMLFCVHRNFVLSPGKFVV